MTVNLILLYPIVIFQLISVFFKNTKYYVITEHVISDHVHHDNL